MRRRASFISAPVVFTHSCRMASAHIECVDDRPLFIADHPHFLEIDADRRQIFRNVADVVVLGAAGQDLATDHQERGRDNLFGSGSPSGPLPKLLIGLQLPQTNDPRGA